MIFNDLLYKLRWSNLTADNPARLFAPSNIITFVNPANFYSFLQFDPENFDYIFSDGILLSRFLGEGNIRRSFDFTSLALPFFRHCESFSKKVLVSGGTPNEADFFAEFVREQVPNISIDCISGYSQSSLYLDLKSVLEEYDYLVLSVGHPFQDRLALQLSADFPHLCIVTSGAFVSQTSVNSGFYYPEIVDRLNLRWAYRAFFNKHVFKRLVTSYPIFCFRFFLDTVKLKFGGPNVY
jgi:UDP-Gal:alpha-D-GlcNAc-diphosphoundecaprenol beta-1,4-galactosyltransferase